ncbi:MAG TPA: hypothetical protein VGR07_05460, partial [Thermoanaerobaculia bacterium]|nr:hypothetical protein [Thermoanaerobaculia bacterium]
MRAMLATLSVALTLAGATSVLAGENDPEIFFSNPTNTELTIKFVAPLDPKANNCDGRTACGQLYYLQQDTGLTTEPPRVCTEVEQNAGQVQDCLPAVTHARLGDDHHALVLNLSLPPLSIKSLHLVLRRLLTEEIPDRPKPEQKLTTIDFTPTLYLDFNDKKRKNLIYRGILLQDKAAGSALVTIVDENKKKVPAQVKQVTAYPRAHPEGNFL